MKKDQEAKFINIEDKEFTTDTSLLPVIRMRFECRRLLLAIHPAEPALLQTLSIQQIDQLSFDRTKVRESNIYLRKMERSELGDLGGSAGGTVSCNHSSIGYEII